jgi:predicted RNA-binding Zn-ribbon protein involved in translation (DUF1610 family)
MKTILELETEKKRLFPCPICGEGLDVRESKKRKPYVVCNSCGMQMFIRADSGIRKFERLVAEAKMSNTWERHAELERHYRKKCPKCGRAFWATEELIKTSMLDGRFVGHRCPEEHCDGIAKPEADQ